MFALQCVADRLVHRGFSNVPALQALLSPLPSAAPPCSSRASSQYAADPEPIVADSCVVALDMLEFEQSGGFQYADDGGAAALASDGAGKEVSASA